MIKNERIKIYPASREQMEKHIASETDKELKKAYGEMLEGCLTHPGEWDWYAMWMIEKMDGVHIGDLCFKGIEAGRNPEIGYGILEEYRGLGFATEAVKLALKWAFGHSMVKAVEAEADPDNVASQRVLVKCGFRPNGEIGEEGPRYIVYGENEMDTNEYTIRLEKEEDHRDVENLVRESFWNVYRPGCSEHYVIHVLRDDPAFVKELDFVMHLSVQQTAPVDQSVTEQDGKLIGQNMFMKTIIKADDGRMIPVLTMGPIGITPELKRKGYGKALLDYSLKKAAEMGFGAVLFEGNIGFYSHCGFSYARNFGIRYHDLPDGADDSFFLCKELIPGYLDDVTGVYQTPQGYYVKDEDVEAFDREFPPKEKRKLPGQIFG
ncbi:MAG: GNAT family N-acetyltransferase [Lachnospiraceae bacterium]|nr:GNAT family N-acetyltransferase [Lachnospiraceae bacterium]